MLVDRTQVVNQTLASGFVGATLLLGHIEAHHVECFARQVRQDIALERSQPNASIGEGGISLEPFPEVRAWLQRVRAQPRFLPMPAVTAEVRSRFEAA